MFKRRKNFKNRQMTLIEAAVRKRIADRAGDLAPEANVVMPTPDKTDQTIKESVIKAIKKRILRNKKRERLIRENKKRIRRSVLIEYTGQRANKRLITEMSKFGETPISPCNYLTPLLPLKDATAIYEYAVKNNQYGLDASDFVLQQRMFVKRDLHNVGITEAGYMSRLQLRETFMGGETLNPEYVKMYLDDEKQAKNWAKSVPEAAQVVKACTAYPDRVEILRAYEAGAKAEGKTFEKVCPTAIARGVNGGRVRNIDTTRVNRDIPNGYDILSDDILLKLGVPEWAIGIEGIEKYDSVDAYHKDLEEHNPAYVAFRSDDENKKAYDKPDQTRLSSSFGNATKKFLSSYEYNQATFVRKTKQALASALSATERAIDILADGDNLTTACVQKIKALKTVLSRIDADKYNSLNADIQSTISELEQKLAEVVGMIDGTSAAPVNTPATAAPMTMTDGSSVSVEEPAAEPATVTANIEGEATTEDLAGQCLTEFEQQLKNRRYFNVIKGQIESNVEDLNGMVPTNKAEQLQAQNAWAKPLRKALNNIILSICGTRSNEVANLIKQKGSDYFKKRNKLFTDNYDRHQYYSDPDQFQATWQTRMPN